MLDTASYFRKKSFLQTLRTDKWWIEPALVFLGLGLFTVYSMYAAFQANNYWYDGGQGGFGGYLSPFYSPLLFVAGNVAGGAAEAHAWFGSWPAWWPEFLPASPAFLVLVFPFAFRFTCYYYRGVYYKAFIGTPPSCAVGSLPHGRYRGETFVLIFQNLHRLAMLFAILYLPILYYDAFCAFFQGGEFGFGVGTLILVINPTLLALYTFGCHSWRHLIGGRKDCFSCAGMGPLRTGVYQKSSWLNQNHKKFAWISLFFVGFTDLYVRLVASGVITDFNTWGN